MTRPKLLLILESLVVLGVSMTVFHKLDGPWLWFAALFLVPDVSMLGYLRSKRVGAWLYNLGHSYATVMLAYLLLRAVGIELGWVMMIWTAHIAFDRVLGFGLKYPQAFGMTHMQRV